MQAQVGNVVLVGTAHISQASVDEVREVIAREQPRMVAVELDQARFRALTEPEAWKQTKLADLIKDGRSFLLLAQAFLGSYQRRMGERFGVQPGAEMLAAIEESKARGSELVLADRDIGITLKRAWGRMGAREKLRITWEFLKALTGASEAEAAGEEMKPEDLLQEDALSLMMEELSEVAPSVSDVLVKERDAYLAGRIREASAKAGDGKLVAIIGAGHLRGVEAHLRSPEGIPPPQTLETMPKKFPVAKAVAYAISAFFIGVFALLGYEVLVGKHECFTTLQGLLVQWIEIKGGLAALGGILAFGHPAAIAVAFVMAPLSPLHPALSSGIMAALAQVKFRPPLVEDYEGVSKLTRVRDFWKNRLTRALLVAAMVNVGSEVAFVFLAGPFLQAIRCLG